MDLTMIEYTFTQLIFAKFYQNWSFARPQNKPEQNSKDWNNVLLHSGIKLKLK